MDNHEFHIRADFDDSLKGIEHIMSSQLKDMKKEALNVAQQLDMDLEKKLKFECNSIYGHHLRVTRAVISSSI